LRLRRNTSPRWFSPPATPACISSYRGIIGLYGTGLNSTISGCDPRRAVGDAPEYLAGDG
jgi:hypothetical protein